MFFEVLTGVDTQGLQAAHPLHFERPMRSALPPDVHYHLLRLVCVEGEVVVLAP